MREIARRLWLFVLILAILLTTYLSRFTLLAIPASTSAAPTSALSPDLMKDCRQKTATAKEEVALTLKELGFGSPYPVVASIFHLYAVNTSPRDEIRLEKSWLMRSNHPEGIAASAIAAIEAEAEAGGYSCFVRETLGLSKGGLITVACIDSKVMMRVIAHEWTHEYLRFSKFRRDLRDLEESLVVLAETEITTVIYEKNGWGELPPRPSLCNNEELRPVRAKVDALLVEGKIEEAEAFMEAERQRLCSGEWCPHRLNQAFLAACEAYGGGSEDNGDAYYFDLLRELRDRYPSLKEFLEDIKGVSSREELKELAAERGIDVSEP